jgi:membrane-bound inhibitor of C-type lysozyme
MRQSSRLAACSAMMLLAALGVAGCKTQGQAPAPPGGNRVAYMCDDGRSFVATFFLGTERADIEFDGQNATLQQIPSGSGATYSDGRIELFTKGNTAFVEVDGVETHSNCLVAP